ncbi:hydroxymethylpyrimidine/phosphomethylpyrimidine kinase [Defluviimonas sp. D31]|uniref:hydroxymethylpyrimidine/phosphomethylpyrimidine kinase n=1 Tax=Defluviimonas sp. D31 TaxID=3083253 RepID=UPI00296FAEAE|nr:hydroxymethylpyrimidine/phosphomethylpyrimidine kinase [Defluviimonas sp. D31]MDW4550000.1 hydroxymethylpyrimidine/phosphomethylpyrimidine kinase [Defluviimonas sp. D31]
MKTVLVIAGFDSGCGAGAARDLAVLSTLGCAARVALTAVTAQTDRGVTACQFVAPALLSAQIAAAFDAGPIDAVKIGMLGDAGSVAAVAAALPRGIPVVLDPVLAASSGACLLDAPGRHALVATLMPLATVVTPNLPEAALLTGRPPARDEPERVRQAKTLLALGAGAVLLKGGHDDGRDACDWLFSAGGLLTLRSPRQHRGRRGTGCTFATAIAAALANGAPLDRAAQDAKAITATYIAGR